MSFIVRVRRAAEADIQTAEVWYEKQRIGLGTEFRSEALSLLRSLHDTPLIYVEAYRGVRRAPVHRFPYLVWYRVSADVVQILACTHGRQNPQTTRQKFQ